ncbi:MAG: hypothetical protein Q7O66_09490 [Dehalococcoidia bacterium]|nr:hypothetical protein [Dehalococcoidia bacterium]
MKKARGAEKDEYVFRYRLRPEGEEAKAPFCEDRLLETFAQQTESLLNLVVPGVRGKGVRIDNFDLDAARRTAGSPGVDPLRCARPLSRSGCPPKQPLQRQHRDGGSDRQGPP